MSKICSNCKFTNPDEAFFCADCGTPLTSSDPGLIVNQNDISTPHKNNTAKKSLLSKIWEWILDKIGWSSENALWMNLLISINCVLMLIVVGVGVIGAGFQAIRLIKLIFQSLMR